MGWCSQWMVDSELHMETDGGRPVASGVESEL